ncbi:hypothetical protein [Kibdelosporangium phytohabitans]|uniref:ESX-1 secretion-associated protein n=1 Tax=Kibdelosporangium phytohabitans TaxID=860235 RepID=A0A0N9HWS8_9PSEU|nr:hypothetical protein [Kibdelosporangium phytohabitans]ALG06507.1 hypothetical protein AOZ06_05810 [Kibdelosporangium phytohabitans]MBE1467684.1 hypothetical protein [Kibdelosporangium phytohabitans]
MSGYAVVIDALRRSSTAANDLSTQLRAVDLDTPVSKLDTALPGTSAGPALTGLGELWRGAVQSISDAAAQFARDLGASADLYSTNETAAAADLRVPGDGMRPS